VRTETSLIDDRIEARRVGITAALCAVQVIEDATWLESIATLLSGKPPTHWDDTDRVRFEVQLAATARTFEHFRTTCCVVIPVWPGR
jgi:hypothetical protein